MKYVFAIVDDNGAMRLVAKNITKRWMSQRADINGELIEFESGEAVLDWYQSERLKDQQTCYLFIMDYNMPGMNGLDTANALRGMSHSTLLRIYGFSAEYFLFQEENRSRKTAAAGVDLKSFNDFLAKTPIVPGEWPQKLDSFVEEWRHRMESVVLDR